MLIVACGQCALPAAVHLRVACVALLQQVILLISVLNGVTKMTGQGVCPDNGTLEALAEVAFKQVCGMFFDVVVSVCRVHALRFPSLPLALCDYCMAW